MDEYFIYIRYHPLRTGINLKQTHPDLRKPGLDSIIRFAYMDYPPLTHLLHLKGPFSLVQRVFKYPTFIKRSSNRLLRLEFAFHLIDVAVVGLG